MDQITVDEAHPDFPAIRDGMAEMAQMDQSLPFAVFLRVLDTSGIQFETYQRVLKGLKYQIEAFQDNQSEYLETIFK